MQPYNSNLNDRDREETESYQPIPSAQPGQPGYRLENQPQPIQPQQPQGEIVYHSWTSPAQYTGEQGGAHPGNTAGNPGGQYQDERTQQQAWNPDPRSVTWNNAVPRIGGIPIQELTTRPERKGWRTGAIALLALVMLLVLGVGLFAGWEFGRNGTGSSYASPSTTGLQTGNTNTSNATIPALDNNNISAVRAAVVNKVKPAVVQINVTTSQGSGLGSGVIIDKRGYIVTNNHVVSGTRTVQVVLSDGTNHQGTVTGTDPADDLAVVKIDPPANMTVAQLGDSSSLKVGQDVMAIGNPLGITQTVTSGIVSALGRNVNEQNGAVIPNAVQTDAPINPGNSGGALVDLQGNVVGIPTLTAVDPEFNTPANGVGFAIPSNRVKFVTPQIIDTGKVTHTGRAALGVRPATVSPNVQGMDNLSIDHGALITGFSPNSPAQQAGLQTGDVIVQIDNKDVNDVPSLQDALLAKNPGDKVAVKVQRGNQQLTVNVSLGELQAGS